MSDILAFFIGAQVLAIPVSVMIWLFILSIIEEYYHKRGRWGESLLTWLCGTSEGWKELRRKKEKLAK